MAHAQHPAPVTDGTAHQPSPGPDGAQVHVLFDGQIVSTIDALAASCRQCWFGIAWITAESAFARRLLGRGGFSDRIVQGVIGVDLNQTATAIVTKLKRRQAFTFVRAAALGHGAVFHPKLFIFELPDGAWHVIVGSANASVGAGAANQECAVHTVYPAATVGGRAPLVEQGLAAIAQWAADTRIRADVRHYVAAHRTRTGANDALQAFDVFCHEAIDVVVKEVTAWKEDTAANRAHPTPRVTRKPYISACLRLLRSIDVQMDGSPTDIQLTLTLLMYCRFHPGYQVINQALTGCSIASPTVHGISYASSRGCVRHVKAIHTDITAGCAIGTYEVDPLSMLLQPGPRVRALAQQLGLVDWSNSAGPPSSAAAARPTEAFALALAGVLGSQAESMARLQEEHRIQEALRTSAAERDTRRMNARLDRLDAMLRQIATRIGQRSTDA
jgi:hypothetical protein